MSENKKLQNLLNYFEFRDGYDLNEVIQDMVAELDMLKHPSMGEHNLSMDECEIEWVGDCICVLEDFVKAYTHKFLEGVCNVIKTEIGVPRIEKNTDISVGDLVEVLSAKSEDIDGILEKYKGTITKVIQIDEDEKSVVVDLNNGNITIDLYDGEYRKV